VNNACKTEFKVNPGLVNPSYYWSTGVLLLNSHNPCTERRCRSALPGQSQVIICTFHRSVSISFSTVKTCM